MNTTLYQLKSRWINIAIVCSICFSLACSQRGKEQDNPDPLGRTGSQIVTLSRGMYKLDALNVEGSSLIPNRTKRDIERKDLARLSAEYAVRYRNVITEAAAFSPVALETFLQTSFTPEEFEIYLPLIQQHLRLAKVNSLPSTAAIAQDFQLLRYKKPIRL